MMLTDDEQRIQEIEGRVRASGQISQEDFRQLLASRLAWRMLAKHKESLENLMPSELHKALDKALEDTTADLIQAQEEIEMLTARIAMYERQFMRSSTSMLLN